MAHPIHPSRHRPPRGAALVLVLVVVGVLTAVAAGLVLRSRGSLESAGAHRQYETGLTCAEGAREMLLSRFRAFHVSVADLTLDQSVGGRKMGTGHFDAFGVKSVEPLGGRGVLAQDAVMGMANRTAQVQLGGAPYRIVVTCSDTTGSGRQAEVEFLIRFGL